MVPKAGRAPGEEAIKQFALANAPAYAHPRGLSQPEMSVGYPHPKVALRLVEGENRDADQGVLGMKCPALMNGYHNRPEL